MAANRDITLGGGTPPPPDTATTALDKLLGDKNSKLITTENDIERIGTRPSYGRLEALQEVRTRLEKERDVLDWTRQLYGIAHEPKKDEKGEKPTQNELWKAIGESKLNFYKDIGAGVWKVVDPMLEQLWGDFGNTEPYIGSSQPYASGYKAPQ